MDNEQIKKGYLTWLYRTYLFKETDDSIEPYLNFDIKAYNGSENWLVSARNAMHIPIGKAAEKMGVSRSAFWKIEESERKGTVRLKTLARAAAAIDCEVVFAIRPIKRERFSRIIWRRLQAPAMAHGWVKTRPENRKAVALAGIAERKMLDSKFRKSQNWTERKLPSFGFNRRLKDKQ